MTILANSKVIAHESSPRVSLRPICGAYELVFSIVGTVSVPSTEPEWLAVSGARISCQSPRGKCDLGQSGLRKPTTICQSPYGNPFGIELIVTLQPAQLMLLEEFRCAGDIDFEIVLIGMPGRGNQASGQAQEQPLRAHVPQSEGVLLLASAKAMNALLLEISVPMAGSTTRAKEIYEHFAQAQSLYVDGHYAESVAACRRAFEELSHGKQQVWDELANQATRKVMDKAARARAILSTLHHYTQIAAHSASRGGTGTFSRTDAKLILSLLGSYIVFDAADT